jgi:hypothetical protein
MCTTSVVNTLWESTQSATDSRVLTAIDYEVQDTWMGQLDPYEERVFDPSRDLRETLGVARAIMVFGTYGAHIGHISVLDLPDHRTDTWRTDLFPGDLRILGYEYLYVDENFLGSLFDFQRSRLENPELYQLLQSWQNSGTGEERRLYRMVSDLSLESGPLAQGSQTLGLTLERYKEYKDHTPQVLLPSDIVVFRPETGPETNTFNELMTLAGYINGTSWDSQNEASLFDLLTILNQTRYEPDLNFGHEETTLLDDWRISKDHEPLNALGIDYVLISSAWSQWLSDAEYAALTNPSNYESLAVWQFEDRSYTLYRVVDSQEPD